jgi:hypothetical protein
MKRKWVSEIHEDMMTILSIVSVHMNQNYVCKVQNIECHLYTTRIETDAMGEGGEIDTPTKGFKSNGVERGLRKKISQLEASIARIKLERDDLARDVESLCLDDASNTTFNVSSVLNERIFVAGGFSTYSEYGIFLPWHYIVHELYIILMYGNYNICREASV